MKKRHGSGMRMKRNKIRFSEYQNDEVANSPSLSSSSPSSLSTESLDRSNEPEEPPTSRSLILKLIAKLGFNYNFSFDWILS